MPKGAKARPRFIDQHQVADNGKMSLPRAHFEKLNARFFVK